MRKKTVLFLILFLLYKIHCVAQVIVGVIINEETQEEIPYVNIGVQNQNIGTVSSPKGEFQLDYLTTKVSDSIIFSSIGYHTQVFTVDSLKSLLAAQNPKVLMKPKINFLEEVVVNAKKGYLKKYGNGDGNKRKKVGFGPNDNLGREIGTVISSQEKDALISKVLINIGVNNYGKIKLRLNVYKWTDNEIGERLNKESLYFDTELKEGIWEMDIEKYGIVVSNDFFISLEYIQDMGEYGLYFTFSFNKSPTFMRLTNNSKWEEITYKNKHVSISINTVLSY